MQLICVGQNYIEEKQMIDTEIAAFALATPNIGYQNQVLGAFKAISDLTGQKYDFDSMFLLPKNIKNPSEIRETVVCSKFPSYETFRKEIFEMIDDYLKKSKKVPKVFIIAYNQAENEQAGSNVDMMCRAVKEYYKEHELGFVLCAVLTSRLHKYKYVDLINVPKHLLSFNSRIRLLRDKKLRKKVLITIGTINNFNRWRVKEKYEELLRIIDNAEAYEDEDLRQLIEKLQRFKKAKKKVVICLGGRVDGPEITFDVNYAKKLYADAERLVRNGFNIVFVNGTRTPNDVTDFLYEKALDNPDIIFQNSKIIAKDDSDRSPQRWRVYSGKNEEIFKKLQKVGNIYPGILGFENTLAVHSMDTYACCETANAAIPTAISSKGLYIDSVLRSDCYNLRDLLCPKYAIGWEEFVDIACYMRVEPKDLNPQILSSPLRVFAESVINKLNQIKQD